MTDRHENAPKKKKNQREVGKIVRFPRLPDSDRGSSLINSKRQHPPPGGRVIFYLTGINSKIKYAGICFSVMYQSIPSLTIPPSDLRGSHILVAPGVGFSLLNLVPGS